MPKVVGVKFKYGPKAFYFESGGIELHCGDKVIVTTQRGVECGTIAFEEKEVDEKSIVPPLATVMRLATEEDLAKIAEYDAKRGEVLKVTREKVEQHKLDMKPVECEYTFDGSKLVIYFTASDRVDFRDLVRDLASAFHTRIELRQIGPRDECRMKGGIAPCGKVCCCSENMSEYTHVSIKMAKTQGLSLNPVNISGLCGRLMCCLAFENAHYSETNKRMPRIGGSVTLPNGRSAVVIGLNQIKETVRTKTTDGESYEIADYPLSEIKFVNNRMPEKNDNAKGGKGKKHFEKDDDETEDDSE